MDWERQESRRSAPAPWDSRNLPFKTRPLLQILNATLSIQSKYIFSEVTDMVWWTRIVLNTLSPILGPKWESHGHIHTETVNWAGVRVGYCIFFLFFGFCSRLGSILPKIMPQPRVEQSFSSMEEALPRGILISTAR